MKLQDFFSKLDDALRAEGMAYGADVWLRVHQLVERLDQKEALPQDKHQLMPLLRLLFCRNPQEQTRFAFIFEQCLSDQPQSLASVNQVDSPQQKAIARSLEKARKIERYWWWGGALLLAFIVTVAALLWPKPQEPFAPRLQPEPEQQAPKKFPWYFLIWLYSLPWLVAAWWLGKIYAPKLALAREPHSGDSLLNQLPFEQPLTPIWGGVKAEQSLRELRAARLIPTRRLDINATVKATARNGDFFQPVYRTRRIAPEHVLLVRSINPNDQQAEMAEELAERFKTLGLQVQVYRFRDDPRWLTRWDGKDASNYFQLAQITAKHSNARLLIISETDILFHPYSGEPRNWLMALSPWQDKAWLHPRDAHKPHARLLAEHDFLTLPLSRDSLPELVSHLTAVQPAKLAAPDTQAIELPDIITAEPDGWLDEQPPYGTDLTNLEWQLEHYLGTYGLRLLRAIAVYPKPNWKLTLALDYLLFGKLGQTEPQARREQRLSRLSRLPWLMHGFLPNWLREHLLVNSETDERQRVVTVWQSLFSRLSKRGGAKSLQLDFSTPPKRQIRLYWEKLRAMPQSDAVNDPIFAHILMGGKFGLFYFQLPRALARRLPYAQRAMSLRPVLSALVGALLGMGVIYSLMQQITDPKLDQAQWSVTIQHQPDTQPLATALQQHLQQHQFQVEESIESADSTATINTITYAPGGKQAAETIKRSLAWLTYGANDIGWVESSQLSSNTIQVQLVQTYQHGSTFNDELRYEAVMDSIEAERDETASVATVIEPEMVRIPPGKFLMGSPPTLKSPGAEPQHEVTIPYPFEISKFEVTFDEYDAFAKATNRALPNDEDWGRGKQPVINVSFNNAQAYVLWLSRRTGAQYRLPTEAEWEYAARANTVTARFYQDDQQCDYANGLDQNAQSIADPGWTLAECSDGYIYTAPVASFGHNHFGLFDMLGNAWEWTQDCWHENYDNAPQDGSAWLQKNGDACDRRVVRGGSWDFNPQILRSAYRGWNNADGSRNNLGFRIARAL